MEDKGKREGVTFKGKHTHTLARLYDSISMKVCYSFLCLTWKANLHAVTEGAKACVCVLVMAWQDVLTINCMCSQAAPVVNIIE